MVLYTLDHIREAYIMLHSSQITNPASAKETTRAYFDSLQLEMRLMDSCVPDTGLKLYGKHFSTPVMTAAPFPSGDF